MWGEPVEVALPGGETTNVGGALGGSSVLCDWHEAVGASPRGAEGNRVWCTVPWWMRQRDLHAALPILLYTSLPCCPCPQLVFIDTEGFESTGKADVYDDRIFALSALMSQVRAGWLDEGLGQGRKACGCDVGRLCQEVPACQHTPPCCSLVSRAPHPAVHAQAPPQPRKQVLIYNLPESIRESDLEKLSFAVELSKAFYSAEKGGTVGGDGGASAAGAADAAGSGGGSAALPVQPGNMVWLIQRDFLKASDQLGASGCGRPRPASRASREWHWEPPACGLAAADDAHPDPANLPVPVFCLPHFRARPWTRRCMTRCSWCPTRTATRASPSSTASGGGVGRSG